MFKKTRRVRHLALSGAAAATLLSVAACGPSLASSASAASKSSSGASGSTYVIGSIGTDSGPYAASSIGGRDAMDAWVKYTNAHGGINGHKVKLILKDDQATGSLALTEAKQLVQQTHVVALVGNLDITEPAWATYMSSQSIPVIGDDLANDYMTTYPNFFPEGATQTSGYFYGVPKVAALQHKTKFGAIYCAETPACKQIADSQQQQAKAAGVTFSFGTAASASATSYTAECLAGKSSGATAVALLLSESVASRVAAACEQQGFHPLWLQAANGFTQQETSDPAMAGTSGPVPDFPWFASSNAAEKTFQSAMRKYEPQDFGSATANGYSESAAQGWASAVIFGAAAKHLPKGGTATGSELEKALYKLPKKDTFGGLTPPISYTSSGPQKPVTCFFTIALKNGKYSQTNGGKLTCKK